MGLFVLAVGVGVGGTLLGLGTAEGLKGDPGDFSRCDKLKSSLEKTACVETHRVRQTVNDIENGFNDIFRETVLAVWVGIAYLVWIPLGYVGILIVVSLIKSYIPGEKTHFVIRGLLFLVKLAFLIFITNIILFYGKWFFYTSTLSDCDFPVASPPTEIIIASPCEIVNEGNGISDCFPGISEGKHPTFKPCLSPLSSPPVNITINGVRAGNTYNYISICYYFFVFFLH